MLLKPNGFFIKGLDLMDKYKQCLFQKTSRFVLEQICSMLNCVITLILLRRNVLPKYGAVQKKTGKEKPHHFFF
jgi:hypothetical protein